MGKCSQNVDESVSSKSLIGPGQIRSILLELYVNKTLYWQCCDAPECCNKRLLSTLNIETFSYCFRCWSPLGYVSTYRRVISLHKYCWYRGTVLHHLMHTLGFGHENNRPDRDSFVKILWDNIRDGEISYHTFYYFFLYFFMVLHFSKKVL